MLSSEVPQTFLDACDAILLELDATGRIVRINRTGSVLLGYTRAELIDCDWFQLCVPAENRALLKSRFARIIAEEPASTFPYEHPILTRGGETPLISWRYGVHRDPSGKVLGVALCGMDVSCQRESETTLRLTGAVFDNTAERITITDTDGTIVAINPAFIASTGYLEAEVIGATPRILKSDRHESGFYSALWDALQETGAWSGEIWNRRKNGEVFPEWLSISSTVDEVSGNRYYIAIGADISAAKRSEERLDFVVNHDPLTELPNTVLFRKRLERALLKAQADKVKVAVFFLDLDNFKTINDSLGHHVGDKVLHAVAHRLKRCIRPQDTLARLGGDEFAIIADLADGEESIDSLASRLLARLAEPLPIRRHRVVTTVSIGVSLFPDSGKTANDLIRNADAAMYGAKERGRNCYQLYQREFTNRAYERLSVEAKLRDAVTKNELRVYYQPQVEALSGHIRGVEALIRWQHPEHGIMQPGGFLPVVKERGLMRTLGTWVLRESCAQAKRWVEAGIGVTKVAVNLSGEQLADPDLPRIVDRALVDALLDPSHLELEITENFVMLAPDETLRVLGALREMGVSLAIDDFGTGHSSLAYLRTLPIQKLKIDRSFVKDIAHDTQSEAIVAAIIALGRGLGMRLTAEGVETDEQRDLLSRQGCDELQGYLLGQPMSPKVLEEALLDDPPQHQQTVDQGQATTTT